MNDEAIVRLILVGISVVFILIAAILVAVNAASASRYSVYQGKVVGYSRHAQEQVARPKVEFMADGEGVSCLGKSMQYRQVRALVDQEVTIYAYRKQGLLGETWNCIVDTGSPLSRPGAMRVMPVAAIFAAVGVFFLFVLKKITGNP